MGKMKNVVKSLERIGTLTKEQQKKREELYRFAWDKLQEYGLKEKGWLFFVTPSKVAEMDNNTLGFCNLYSKQIQVSLEWLLNNDIEVIKRTVLHEIAHALVGTPHRHNNKQFINNCSKLGIKAGKGASNVRNPFPKKQSKIYIGTCPVCGKVYIKSRRYNGSCGECSKVYDDKYKLIWR